jgi:hypothetical protein
MSGLVLRRQPGAPGGTASVTEVRDRLNAGLDGFDGQLIDAFSSQLPRGDYLVMLLERMLGEPPHVVTRVYPYTDDLYVLSKWLTRYCESRPFWS